LQLLDLILALQLGLLGELDLLLLQLKVALLLLEGLLPGDPLSLGLELPLLHLLNGSPVLLLGGPVPVGLGGCHAALLARGCFDSYALDHDGLGWLGRFLLDLGRGPPALVGTVVTFPEDDRSVVSVLASINVQALASVVPDGLSCSFVDGDADVRLLVVLSQNSLANVVGFTLHVGDGEVPLVPGSDGIRSGVVGPPLV